jgi:nitrite transporter NirC
MYHAELAKVAEQSKAKAGHLEQMPLGYLILSALAGVYLGLGITLIFSVGAPFAAAASPGFKLVMGAAFGIALTLVIFGGSELFTGNNMVCAIGALTRAISWETVGWIFLVSLAGNLLGSLAVAWLVAQSGVLSQAPQIDLLMKVASTKMHLSGWELLIRGILCNWLVCLAVWTAGRTSNDAAKLVLIFWCLLAFVGSGYEHSIANQSLLGMALFLPHPDAISWNGFLWNQLYVLIGNVIGGSVFVGGLYWLASVPWPQLKAATEMAASPAPNHSASLNAP